MIAVGLAYALIIGAPWVDVAAIGLVVVAPLPVAVALGCVIVVDRFRPSPDRHNEPVYVAAIAAELRSGASLRAAIDVACDRVPEMQLVDVRRLARSGAPMIKVARCLASRFPQSASVLVPALTVASGYGGASAAVFDRLALRIERRVELEREVVVASAQARASAVVLALLPVLLVAALWVSGAMQRLWMAGPIGVGALAIGLALETCGIAAVLWLARRLQR